MADDFDLSLSPIKKSAPTKGRRANASAGKAFEDDDEEFLVSSTLKSRPVSGELFLDEDIGPARSKTSPTCRRTGGWADETSRAKTAKSVRMSMMEKGGIGSDDEDDDGPLIPDLDDVRDEDMAFTVADAPSVAVNRVATYKELDSDLLKHVAFATLDDIDLRLLTLRMVPESALKEPDEPWHWDVIFAEVSSELQKEWYPDEELDVENNNNSNENSKVASAADNPYQGPTKERPYTAFNRFPV